MEKEIAMRSCWNCNSGHEHLKKAKYIFWCFECGKYFYKGKEYKLKELKELIKESKS